MRARDFLPTPPPLRLLAGLVMLACLFPSRTYASVSAKPHVETATTLAISFGQELGNIRPFRITIDAHGGTKATAPIHLADSAHVLSKDVVAALLRLADAEGFRAIPAFTSCPGTLPDIAARYISIRTSTWQHRAAARGTCLESINQLFAVLMEVTHAAF